MRSPLPIPSLSNDVWFAGTSATRPIKADAVAARTMRAMLRHAQDVWSWQKRALPFVKHAAAVLWEQQWTLVLFIGTAAALACLAALSLQRKTSFFRGEESAFDWLRKDVDAVDADKADFAFDDLEFEDDESDNGAASPDTCSSVQRLKRVFSLSAASIPHRRGSRDIAKRARPTSIIRITSSDPLSQLSSSAFEMDLDTRTRTRTDAGHTSAGSGLTSQGSNLRRRRESGKLTPALAEHARLNLTRQGASPSRTIRSHKIGASRPGQASPLLRERGPESKIGRRASLLERQVSDGADSNRRTSMISASSSDSYASASSDEESFKRSTGLPSILTREPKQYLGLSAMIQPQNDVDSDDSTHFHGSEHLSWSHRPDFSPYASSRPDFPRLGTLSRDQARSLWPEKKCRLVRLCEPDWRPYAGVHERARERLRAAEQHSRFFNLCGEDEESARSAPPLPPVPRAWDDDVDLGAERAFWFERFTQSTAAAGRDWDWRKRRARASALAAAMAAEGAIDADGVNTFAGADSADAKVIKQAEPMEGVDPNRKRGTAPLSKALTSLRTTSLNALHSPQLASAFATRAERGRSSSAGEVPVPTIDHANNNNHRDIFNGHASPNAVQSPRTNSRSESPRRAQENLIDKRRIMQSIQERRARNAAITAQLLKDADDVDIDEIGAQITDSPENGDVELEDAVKALDSARDDVTTQQTLQAGLSSLDRRKPAARKAASSTQIERHNSSPDKLYKKGRKGILDRADTWSQEMKSPYYHQRHAGAGYSSADAYGPPTSRDVDSAKGNGLEPSPHIEGTSIPKDLNYLSEIFTEPLSAMMPQHHLSGDLKASPPKAQARLPPSPPPKPSRNSPSRKALPLQPDIPARSRVPRNASYNGTPSLGTSHSQLVPAASMH